jgi:hypothetical protein
VRNALLKTFLFQEFNYGGQNRIAILAGDQRLYYCFDGSSRLAVFVERVCLEQQL